MRKALLAVIAACSIGCSDHDHPVESSDVGLTVGSHIVGTAWNAPDMTHVECEKASVAVRGFHTVIKGKKAMIHRYNDGSRGLAIEGEPKAWQVF